MLFTEPVVFFFSVWISFSWAVLYLQFGSIPVVFQTNHSFNIEQTGAVFSAMCAGVILATIISIGQDKIASRYKLLPQTAEARLYFSCIESALMPIGLFWFGWTSYSSIPYIVPALAVGCATMGIFSIYLAVFNYLADTYHRYASSAIAAQSCCMYPQSVLDVSDSCYLLDTRPELTRWCFSAGYEAAVYQSGVSCGI